MTGTITENSFCGDTVYYNNQSYKKSGAFEIINDKNYQEYLASGLELPAIAPMRTWRSLSSFTSIDSCPDSRAFRKFFCYIPCISFAAGRKEIAVALHILKTRVSLNENKLKDDIIDLKDDNRFIILRRSKCQNFPLSLLQRTVITAGCIVNIIRGLFAICFIGFLFTPIDLISFSIGDPLDVR